MAMRAFPKRYALLAGVNFYQNDGSRKDNDGNELSVQNLKGCLNDIEAFGQFLMSNFELCQLWTLSSSSRDGREPTEPEDKRPTRDNIKTHFDIAYSLAEPGDLFLFYFSGHGTTLPRVKQSPPGRTRDPSLLTADYYSGKPAIRGWQLNIWLKKFQRKKIQVAVILDSCHSGGSWRTDDSIRYQDLSHTPNLTEDEDTIEETADETNNRNAQADWSWSVNPEGLTLMTACTSQQVTEEDYYGGVKYGAFTYWLLQSLQQHGVGSTYRIIHENTITKLLLTKPELYGRADLTFFGNKESSSCPPILARVEGTDIILPIGKAHGVLDGSDFITHAVHSPLVFTVFSTAEFHCRARAPLGFGLNRGDTLSVIPSRWSTGQAGLMVDIQPSLGAAFKQLFQKALDIRVAGYTRVVFSNDMAAINALFKVRVDQNNNITIHGPVGAIGYSEPVRGLHIRAGDMARGALDSAIAISHLHRFNQIYRLKNPTSSAAPFQVSRQVSNTGSQSHKLNLKNSGNLPLYITVVNLTPGYGVKQIWPPSGNSRQLGPHAAQPFPITMTVPEQLRSRLGRREHRDIVRFIVTDCEGLCFKGAELPDIWDAEKNIYTSPTMRNAFLESNTRELPQWWIKDVKLSTKA